MAMPQRDDLIEEIKRTDLLLEWAVQHGDEAEAERLREKLRKLAETILTPEQAKANRGAFRRMLRRAYRK